MPFSPANFTRASGSSGHISFGHVQVGGNGVEPRGRPAGGVEAHGAQPPLDVPGDDPLDGGAHQRRPGLNQRHGLALHVGSHQRAVGIVVFKEGDQGRSHRYHLLGGHVHVIHALGRHDRKFVHVAHGDQVIDELPERVHSPHVNYVTPAGLRQLQEQVAGLLARRKSLSGTVSAENKKQLTLIDRDLRYFEERIRRAVLIDPANQPKDEVHFGAVVEVETPEGRRMTFAIVGEDEADAAQGKISWVSPLARALEDARVGEGVLWKRPAGEVELTVVGIR